MKPALTLEPSFRSGTEKVVAEQFDEAGITYTHEDRTGIVAYEVPARQAKYLPDFRPSRCGNLIIEVKGHFGANNNPRNKYANMKDHSAKERQKFALLKEQHPELDIRFVFSNANAPIYKGSPTTHADWAEDHGFKWAHKKVPAEWLSEIKSKQGEVDDATKHSSRATSDASSKKRSRSH